MMSIVSKSILILRKAAALMLLPLLAWSCQLVTDDFDDETANISNATQYINITISVSASESPFTRAKEPKGGEEGDGREAAQTAETAVEGVTVIFFQNYGINATDVQANATMIDYVEYFDNMQLDNAHATQHLTGHENEVFYTTGQRELSTLLNIENPYHMLVVANANLTSQITPGTTTLKQVRDMTQANFKNGNNKFIMSSKEDHTINFNNSTYDKSTNRRTFYLDCIHIERLAARIDYCTEGATYDTDKNGYSYQVGSSSDRFVVTKVTPFNLYNEPEYLFKRVQNAWSGTITTTYLGDETTDNTNIANNYVVDPNTAQKDASHTFTYLSPIAETMSTDYAQMMNSDQNKNRANQNIIIAYARENTLMPTSPLKKYATGLAFEGDYYVNGTGTPEKRVYYHYLRHQGENEQGTAYQAKRWADINETDACETTPMNYGIVRNNIYRVKISGITEDGLNLNIKVKKWDKFEHATIYM